jgi:acetyltransferase-like isoleucine patch superfamily enzyme
MAIQPESYETGISIKLLSLVDIGFGGTLRRLISMVASILRRIWQGHHQQSRISWLAFLDEYCVLGNHTCIDRFCVFHSVQIGDYSYIGYNSSISLCTIGRFCSIASGVIIGLGRHPVHFVSTSPAFYNNHSVLGTQWANANIGFLESQPVKIGNDVWIGANAIIMGGITIGDGSVIGAGAVVTKDVEPYTIVGGVPAKLIRQRFELDVISELLAIRWWDWKIEIILQRVHHFQNVNEFIRQYKKRV